jgi:hypothetical protein
VSLQLCAAAGALAVHGGLFRRRCDCCLICAILSLLPTRLLREEVAMDTNERGRKRREMVAPREEPESVPPPARKRKELHELDPERLWDKETDENSDEEESDDDDSEESFDDAGDDSTGEDLDDWDHPIRRLKIN